MKRAKLAMIKEGKGGERENYLQGSSTLSNSLQAVKKNPWKPLRRRKKLQAGWCSS